MRVLILNSDYPEFVAWLYGRNPGLGEKSYEEQLRTRMESLFGVADFYSRNLRKLGHEAWDVHANNEFMQNAWASEHDIHVPAAARRKLRSAKSPDDNSFKGRVSARVQSFSGPRRLVKAFGPMLDQSVSRRASAAILAAQVKHYAPDVLLNQSMDDIPPSTVRGLKRHTGLLVGQVASDLPKDASYKCYDLVLSSLPSFVERFRREGIPSEFHRFSGFEPDILPSLKGIGRKIEVSFAGSLFRLHAGRIRLLETLSENLPLEVWGPGIEGLPETSPIRKRYMGMAWGRDMYSLLRDSKVTVNNHTDFAGPYAANMRLFEATGVGTLLVTDWKPNLHDLFEPDREVVTYRSAEECAALVRHYLDNEAEREAIAAAGQQRTLRDHTYRRRLLDFVRIIERYTQAADANRSPR